MGLVAMRIFSSFLFSVMLIFIALFCSLPSALARPNFVLVLTDDMEVAPVGYMYWTKTLIRAQGVAFQRAYVASPLCAPARATTSPAAIRRTPASVATATGPITSRAIQRDRCRSGCTTPAIERR